MLTSFHNIKEDSAPFIPLSAAAFAGHEEIVQLLLSPQFCLSWSCCYFFQALSLAVEGGHSTILQTLLGSADFADLED